MAAVSGRTQPQGRELTLRQLRAWLRRDGRLVLTFSGYSASSYQNPQAMLAAADKALGQFDPRCTRVNGGATAAGIGAVYALARRRGFATMGVVSTLARESDEPLSPFVDQVFFIRDATWGGWLPGSRRLSPASTAMLAATDVLVRIGGGSVARAEWARARRAGIDCTFVPALPRHC